MQVVVDASVWLGASGRHEPFHDECVEFVREAIERHVSFLLPALVLPEVAGTAARLTRDSADGRAMMEHLQKVPNVRFVDLDLGRARAAAALAARLFLRGADAQYAALADEHHASLVTLDREMRERAMAVVECRTPGQWLDRFAGKSA